MELRHLRYFSAVAEEMHVTRAAKRLGLAQSALTHQIKALEAEMGLQLLRRVGRRIELTEAGVAFWQEAKAILERVRVGTLLAQETARGAAGRLSIGLTETASFAPDVTAVLQRARLWPKVQLNLVQARTADLVTALIERQLDVAFVRSPAPKNALLQWRPFMTEGLVVVMPNAHLLASRRTVKLSALVGEGLVLPSGRRGEMSDEEALRGQLTEAFAGLGHTLNIAQETPEYVMAINLVAAGWGLALVPSVLNGLRRDAVTYRPLHSTPPLRTQIIVMARRHDISPIAANFLELATKTAGARKVRRANAR